MLNPILSHHTVSPQLLFDAKVGRTEKMASLDGDQVTEIKQGCYDNLGEVDSMSEVTTTAQQNHHLVGNQIFDTPCTKELSDSETSHVQVGVWPASGVAGVISPCHAVGPPRLRSGSRDSGSKPQGSVVQSVLRPLYGDARGSRWVWEGPRTVITSAVSATSLTTTVRAAMSVLFERTQSILRVKRGLGVRFKPPSSTVLSRLVVPFEPPSLTVFLSVTPVLRLIGLLELFALGKVDIVSTRASYLAVARSVSGSCQRYTEKLDFLLRDDLTTSPSLSAMLSLTVDMCSRVRKHIEKKIRFFSYEKVVLDPGVDSPEQNVTAFAVVCSAADTRLRRSKLQSGFPTRGQFLPTVAAFWTPLSHQGWAATVVRRGYWETCTGIMSDTNKLKHFQSVEVFQVVCL